MHTSSLDIETAYVYETLRFLCIITFYLKLGQVHLEQYITPKKLLMLDPVTDKSYSINC